jgi:hypothetical protein
VGPVPQEERAARENAEARAEAVRADKDAEMAALRAGLAEETAAEAEARTAAEKELNELRVALAQARTATDAVRAQLTAEKIQAQQRTAAFDKQKQDIEVGVHARSAPLPHAGLRLKRLAPMEIDNFLFAGV